MANDLKRKLSKFWRRLGPGLVTGAADDDPSGIATYSQTGAQFGFGMLWTALYQIPLLIAIQEACARIGLVTGRGLAGVVKAHYSRKILTGVVLLVVVANVINIGADIGAIAASLKLVLNLPFVFYAVVSAISIVLLEVFISYKNYSKFLKWLALSLFAYPVTAFIVKQNWGEILRATLIPHIQLNFAYLFIVVGVFGTTITPYCFFWQASEEVEEELAIHTSGAKLAVGIPHLLRDMRFDTYVGMLASEIAQWFIIITTATVLFAHGITNINTAADAAKALEPLVKSFPNSGQIAKDLFAVGIIGLGLLGIPVLAGSSAYALSEAFGWREGLSKKFHQARGFYGIIIVATLIGLLLNFIGLDPIKALVFTAVINGVVAVPLLFVIGRINANPKILGEYTGSGWSRFFIWAGFAVMLAASLGMFYALFFK